jgi:hypothetical protein
MHDTSSGTRSRVRTCFAVVLLGLTGVMAGCGESANPVSPSPLSGPLAVPSDNLSAQASAEHLNPTELEKRGWTCFPPPVPNRIVCSHPNQGFPTIADPPPADRPASFTFKVFDGTGRFVGTEILLRTDLYKGQICESTREPYVFVPVIGYYECVHTAGQ